MILLTAAYYVYWSFGLVFLVCESGEHVHCEFNEINNEIVEQIEWYSLPFEVKRTLPIILCNAQKSVYLECFGSSSCCRTIFKEVSRRKKKVLQNLSNNLKENQYFVLFCFIFSPDL